MTPESFSSSKMRMITIMLLVWSALYLVAMTSAHGQAVSLSEDHVDRNISPGTGACNEGDELCLQRRAVGADSTTGRLIVIGFVGGFVKHDDTKHPEVQFAARLRDRYAPGIYAEVYENHNREEALRKILLLLDTNRDGRLTAVEKEQARIIIYGHSWGASETVTLARELWQRNIPVLLTIQVDSIAKPGEQDASIPPNVANAVNFYQSGGLFHGRSEIFAADAAQTKIIGNFLMTYKDRSINCENSPWRARIFMRSHIEIENDPRVWGQVASLIDSELLSMRTTELASSLSK
jgi:hypothetical protein